MLQCQCLSYNKHCCHEKPCTNVISNEKRNAFGLVIAYSRKGGTFFLLNTSTTYNSVVFHHHEDKIIHHLDMFASSGIRLHTRHLYRSLTMSQHQLCYWTPCFVSQYKNSDIFHDGKVRIVSKINHVY
jgi:hypothetical protein